ncbi:MAG: peptidylprolyl isomerase [Yoonia sp.]
MRFFILALTLIAGTSVAAQGSLQPVITVNSGAVTAFELDQRKRMLEVFRTPGNLTEAARVALIEDRLKQQLLASAGLKLSEESLRAAMSDFAGRANLELDQFIDLLAANGVAEETLRDFVSIGVSWRDYIRNRYGSKVRITDAEVNRAIAQTQSGGAVIEVLLSEIIIAAPPPRAAQAMATAQRISQLRSTSAFEAQARRVSALPSRSKGGRLGWLPITNYPPQIQNIIMGLSPGEVTEPLPITNGVALFQLRAIREAKVASVPPTEIDYAVFYINGGKTPAGIAAAQHLVDRTDTCNDLYGAAKDLPADVLDRRSLAPADIPQDVALELARLDTDEMSYNLTRNDGQTLMVLMMCGRTNAESESVDAEAIRNQLRSQRLASLATALLEDMRTSATITTR